MNDASFERGLCPPIDQPSAFAEAYAKRTHGAATASPMEIPEGRHLVVHEIHEIHKIHEIHDVHKIHEVHERVVRAMLRQFPMSSDPAMAATMKPMPACIATR